MPMLEYIMRWPVLVTDRVIDDFLFFIQNVTKHFIQNFNKLFLLVLQYVL